jgi:hypothetical protein
MAASNAVFWTTERWDGSEEMIQKSRGYCLREPAHTHIDLVSGTSAKTLVVTLQGVEAIYTILLGIAEPRWNEYARTLAFNHIFGPLAVFGLLRLPAAFWMTEDYSFANFDTLETTYTNVEILQEDGKKQAITSEVEYHTTNRSALEALSEAELFHPASSWRGIAVRTFFLALLFPLWGITVYYISPLNGVTYTTTTLLVNILYLIFLSVAIMILVIYFLRGSSRTTIIPCASTIWYKLYTDFLLIFTVAIIIIAGLETRRTPCGKYTTYPSQDDGRMCPKLSHFIS